MQTEKNQNSHQQTEHLCQKKTAQSSEWPSPSPTKPMTLVQAAPCMCVSALSCVLHFATPWPLAYQAPLLRINEYVGIFQPRILQLVAISQQHLTDGISKTENPQTGTECSQYENKSSSEVKAQRGLGIHTRGLTQILAEVS